METSPSFSKPSETHNGHTTNGHSFRNALDAFDLSDDAKIKMVSHHFGEIMKTLGLDLNEAGLKETPRRIARMYVKEMFKGLNRTTRPSITLFEDRHSYSKLVIQKNIALQSVCERHFLPIIGKVHVAYISNGKTIGLSKLNRIVEYHSKRPQAQERLTEEIANSMKEALGIQDVAVLIDAMHLSVTMRGVKDTASSTITSYFGGKFQREDTKTEFLLAVK